MPAGFILKQMDQVAEGLLKNFSAAPFFQVHLRLEEYDPFRTKAENNDLSCQSETEYEVISNMDINYRHEVKHYLNWSDLMSIRARARAVMQPDPHAKDGKYLIRSLYFDTPEDKALREKIDGVNLREKFRIRYYNEDTSFIHLEKKSKHNSLGTKYDALLSAGEARRIVNGDTEWMLCSDRPLVQELYVKMKYQGLRPKTIVDYTREPFIYGPGNVRVTFDYDIRTGLKCTDFLNPNAVTIPAGERVILMEVKWDAYLPSVIRDIVQTHGRRSTAFSKYAICRIYD